jgi:hypothetical protein
MAFINLLEPNFINKLRDVKILDGRSKLHLFNQSLRTKVLHLSRLEIKREQHYSFKE